MRDRSIGRSESAVSSFQRRTKVLLRRAVFAEKRSLAGPRMSHPMRQRLCPDPLKRSRERSPPWTRRETDGAPPITATPHGVCVPPPRPSRASIAPRLRAHPLYLSRRTTAPPTLTTGKREECTKQPTASPHAHPLVPPRPLPRTLVALVYSRVFCIRNAARWERASPFSPREPTARGQHHRVPSLVVRRRLVSGSTNGRAPEGWRITAGATWRSRPHLNWLAVPAARRRGADGEAAAAAPLAALTPSRLRRGAGG